MTKLEYLSEAETLLNRIKSDPNLSAEGKQEIYDWISEESTDLFNGDK